MALDPNQEILRRPKKLICALDGTWMDSDSGWVGGGLLRQGHLQTPSNVTRITRAIKPEDSEHYPQVVFYQAGVGTGLGLWNQIVGGGTGLGLSEHIREAYTFLANNYSPGDSIFLIGFSRGSFTARSLGGLIGQLGLLNKKGLPHFYEIFHDWEHAGDPATKGSRFWEHYRDPDRNEKEYKLETPSNDPSLVIAYLREYRALLRSLGLSHTVPIREDPKHDVPIRAIAVWDTVGALGIPINPWLQKHFRIPGFLHEYKWLDTRLSDNVSNAFQALALDEHRAPFSPAVWERPEGCQTKLKQVWFSGSHSCCGGSYDDTATADITLAWMMDQLSGEGVRSKDSSKPERKDWIEFYDDYLEQQHGLNALWYKEHPPAREWSLGTLYDSFRFPQSLAGRIVRTPGRYRVTDPLNGIQERGVLMRDTQEFIHASVRVRMNLRGRGVESRPSGWSSFVNWFFKVMGRVAKPYRSEALRDWVLHDGHEHHDSFGINSNLTTTSREEAVVRAPYWSFHGKDRHVAEGLTLSEDVMGRFEIRLLKRFGGHAADIEASNKGVSVEQLRKVQAGMFAVPSRTW